jgi:hypothetical protein
LLLGRGAVRPLTANCNSRFPGQNLRERNAEMTCKPSTSASRFLTLACHHVAFRFQPFQTLNALHKRNKLKSRCRSESTEAPIGRCSGNWPELCKRHGFDGRFLARIVSSSPIADSHPHPKKTSRYWKSSPIRLLNSSAHGPLLPGRLLIELRVGIM